MDSEERENGIDGIVERIAAAAAAVHAQLGPGLRRAAYADALGRALGCAGLRHAARVWLPEQHRSYTLSCGYTLDFVVEGRVLVQVQAAPGARGAGRARLRHALALSGLEAALSINFNAHALRDGVERLDSAGALPAAC